MKRAATFLISILLLAPTLAFAGWYDNAWSNRKAITIDHTKVSATETDFPALIYLTTDSDLSATAQADGDDILFTSSDGTTKLKHEIERYEDVDGELIAWIKIPSLSSSVDTVIYMYYGNSSASAQSDPTNVWNSSFMSVLHMNSDVATEQDSTANNKDGSGPSVVEHSLSHQTLSTSPGLSSHQGIARDGTYYYSFDTNALKKWNTSWSSITTNTDPNGDVCATCNHVGDGDIYNGQIYIGVEKWNSCADTSAHNIAKFSTTDLSLTSTTDISTTLSGVTVAGVAVDATAGANGTIYIVDYCNSSYIYRLDLSDYSDLGAITLSSSISNMQGIDVKGNQLYVSSASASGVIRVDLDGTVRYMVKKGAAVEGIDILGNSLMVLDVVSTDKVYTYDFTEKIGQNRRFRGVSDDFLTESLTLPDDGAITFWYLPHSSYDFNTVWDNSAGSNFWESWTNASGVLNARIQTGDAVTYDIDNISGPKNWYKVDYKWSKTGSSYLFVNGVQRSTDVTSAWTAPGTSFYVNGGNTGNTEGQNNFDEFRIITGTLSNDFIATSYNNESSPGTFYSLGSEEAPSSGWANKVNGASSPAKVNGVSNASISKVNGVA